MFRPAIKPSAFRPLAILAVVLLSACGGSGGGGGGGPTPTPTPSPTPTPTPTPGPTVTLSASPASVAVGGTTTLTWGSANATGCSIAGDNQTFPGLATSGTQNVRPSQSATFTVTCTGPSGSGSASTSVQVLGPTGAFADPDNGNIPDRAKHPMAFPTAIGFGKVTSVRAADAVVYKINTLEDTAVPGDGKITYRECALALQVTTPYAIPAGKPRYCVFDVAGAIQLQSQAWITIPKIYIAGQTSPGGIEFRLGANYSPVDSLIDTRRGGNDMIVRHVRVRLGEHPTRSSDNGDAIRLNGTDRQIIDHVTTQYGTDESMEMDCTNCTVQWSIIGPNICRNAGHSSALHCKTFFLKPAGNVTIAHNISQHGNERGINLAIGTAPAVAGTAMQADIFNNVVYHFVEETGLISNQFSSVYANYFGNVALRGPRYNAINGNYFPALYNGNANTFPFGFSMYMKDNVTPRSRVAGAFGQSITDAHSASAGIFSGVSPSSICGVNASGAEDCSITGLNVIQSNNYVTAPGFQGLQYETWQATGPAQAMRDALAFAGADLCRDGLCRDNVDLMFIDDIRTCDAAPYLFLTDWTSTAAATGGYAQITQGAAKTDSDNDGMPNDWESRFTNTNPNLFDANADADGDGYPNIEEYLNFLARDDQRYAGFIGSGTGSLPAYNCNRPMF